ncbi:winged helix-turn-helix transcriptional regulator [Patescibacteria group bacterium]|nr:winged helix-turn-helix transcriptional regulator [Patescibacteria group bacterium]
MPQIIAFVLGIIIGVGVGFWWAKRKDSSPRRGGAQNDNQGAGDSRQTKEKQVSKQKIMAELGRVERVTNDDIQKLLGVSDATATRYLDELEKEGKIRQVGETGKYVYYEKI